MAVRNFEIINRVTTESVEKHTGKGWKFWIPLLQKAGAQNWEHREIVDYLSSKHKLSMWWRQIVAQGFQVYVGLRVEGRNLKGLYSVTVTKSLPIGHLSLWEFLTSEEGQAVWLRPLSPMAIEKGATFEVEGGIFGEVRTFKKPERLRLKWQDDQLPKASIVQIYVGKRPGEKSLLVFMCENLATARDRENQRDLWRAACERVLQEVSKSAKPKAKKKTQSKAASKRKPAAPRKTKSAR